MKRSFRLFLLLLYFSLTIVGVAQEKMLGQNAKIKKGKGLPPQGNEIPDGNTNQNDSLLSIGNPKDVKTYSFYSKHIGLYPRTTIDTTLNNIELYSPTKQTHTFYQDLGITGSANTPILLDFTPQTSFDIGIHAYDLYIRDLSEVVLIETPTPFTQLSYVMGPEKENILRIQHAQSFNKEQIKAGIDFKLFNTVGFYTRQKMDVKNFNGNLSYQTKDKRYSIEGVYFHNKLILQENGGITYDSLYEDNLELNRQIISVNLSQAENFIKYSGIGIRQDFYISKAEPDFSSIPDTNILSLEGYSVYHYKKPYFDPILPLGRLSHTFIYSKEIYQYSDSDGALGFYSDISGFPEDLSRTFDSISHRKIENIISYSSADYKDDIETPKFLSYSFGLGIVSNRYSQDNYKYALRVQTLSELNPQGRIQLFLTKRYSLTASGIYSYRSDNTSAYKLNGNLNLQIGKNSLDIAIQSSSTQPYWIYSNYYSDYFQWKNNFRNQKHQELRFQFKRKRTQIKAKTGLIHDYLYFDSNVAPQQFNEALSYFSLNVYQGIRLGNLGFDLNLAYQGVNKENIIQLPKIYSHAKLFYTNILFNGALDMQLGISLRYFTRYYANAYMPALRSFYLQNETQFGDYPYFDVFLNAKIKGARLFIKYEQLNSGFMPQNYFISPHYANPDPSIKFGVIWQLFN